MKDPYEVLGIDRDATTEDVKKSYRKLVIVHHPDKPTGNAEKFKEIQTAYEILSDPEKRQNFDQFGDPEGQPQHHGFPGGFPGMPQQQIKRNNTTHQVFLTLLEAFHGCTKKFKVPIKKVCQACKQHCPMCNGVGMIHMFIVTQACPACHGSGGASRGCSDCSLKGHKTETVTMTFNIPVGVETGQTMVARGMGEQAIGRHDIAGDFVLHVQVRDHPVFLRDGRNLVILKKISFKESIEGTTVDVPHFLGEFTVDTKQWGVLDPRKNYVVKDKGMKGGDLHIGFDIQYPDPSGVYIVTKVV
jgi:DnaJ-class molecular chaperone